MTRATDLLSAQPFEAAFLGGPAFQLPWPTAFDSAGLADDLGEIVAWVRRTGARLVTARVPATAGAVCDALSAAGFILVERLLTLERPAAEAAPFPPGVAYGGADAAEACAAIAGAAFRQDRFHADRRIDPAAATAIKAAWVRNGFAGRAESCLVARGEGGAVEGFLLTLRRGDAVVIDLVAVAPDRQGQGVGRRLMEAVLSHAAATGACRVRVGTQADNEISLRLYRQSGFAPVADFATFHFIPEPFSVSRSLAGEGRAP